MIVTRCLLLSIFVIGNISFFVDGEDNLTTDKNKNTVTNLTTAFDNETMVENFTKIHPSYINQLIIAGNGYNEKILKELEIEEKLRKIILISIQLSLSNHLSKNSISRVETNMESNEFYWDFEISNESNTYNVNMSQTNLITNKNIIKVKITGLTIKQGHTYLYFIVQYKNNTVHSDIISEDLSLLTLSHISAFLGLPIVEINSLLSIGQNKGESNNWWIILLMFSSGLILFFICWCMLFIYFNSCGQIINRVEEKTTMTKGTIKTIDGTIPNIEVPKYNVPSLNNELKRKNDNDDKNLEIMNNNYDVSKSNNNKERLIKNLSKINLFQNNNTLPSQTTRNSIIEDDDKIFSFDDNTSISTIEKNELDGNFQNTFSDFERLEKVERNNKQIYDRTISKNKRLKGRKGIKRPYSAKIREPAFKDVNEFKNIIKEEKTILEPEKLFENEWTPYKSGDYIAKHFIRNMEPQYYPTPKKLLRDDFIISS